jgi:hypothetical protein
MCCSTIIASTHDTAAFVAWWRGHFCGCVEGIAVRAGPAFVPPGGDVGVKARGLRSSKAPARGPIYVSNMSLYSSTYLSCPGLSGGSAVFVYSCTVMWLPWNMTDVLYQNDTCCVL